MTQITLPWPSSDLSANSRAHWAPKARATAKHRGWALIATKNANPVVPATGDISVEVRFIPPHRRFDTSNMPHLAKAYLDDIADALKVNDSRFLPSYTFAEPQKPGHVLVTIGGDA